MQDVVSKSRGSSVVSALNSGARGPRFDPRSRQRQFRSLKTLSLVSIDRDVNWMFLVQGKSPPVQLKETYGNLDMGTCMLYSCNPECTMYTCSQCSKASARQ